MKTAEDAEDFRVSGVRVNWPMNSRANLLGARSFPCGFGLLEG